MAKSLPRVQLNPEVHQLVESAGKAVGMSNQDVIALAMRQLILNQDATKFLRDIAIHSTAELAMLAGKIDAISDFIADRYALDMADAEQGE
ncbi:hypothetical protein DevBK_11690 [Devosia sp. BK]|uniref:hypothetical protein n=1 Tax=Devosia sp. BK TaxID=2871706 RepID=UPI002939926D|nr:hypothetical protein [Devosia sp. BK]MDV3251996.1 hypothetical protein [Devosia sp. BK]